MNAIVTFIASVTVFASSFISSIFGYVPQSSNESPVVVTESASAQQKFFTLIKSRCKYGMSCSFCKNGSHTEWNPKISDGGVTYYDSNGTILAIVGGMKSDGNAMVKKFDNECQEVK